MSENETPVNVGFARIKQFAKKRGVLMGEQKSSQVLSIVESDRSRDPFRNPLPPKEGGCTLSLIKHFRIRNFYDISFVKSEKLSKSSPSGPGSRVQTNRT